MHAARSGYPQANCRVQGGLLKNLQQGKKPLSTFRAHNFADKVDILIPLKLYSSSSLSSSVIVSNFKQIKNYKLRCKLRDLLSGPLLQLIRIENVVVKLFGFNCHDLDPIVVSIINNQLCVTLDRINSLKTGIHMKKSQFKGVERYNFIIDLTIKDLSSNLNFLKLLKFFQSIDDDDDDDIETPIEFILSVQDKSMVPMEIPNDIKLELMLSVDELNEQNIEVELNTLSNISIVDLKIHKNDPEWALQLMEYLDYVSIGGQQLSTTIDPFLSQYSQTVDIIGTEDVIRLTLKSSLVPSCFIVESFINCMNGLEQKDWFAILTHGLVNSNYSFGFSEHVVHENGENNTCFLVNGDEFVLWEITGGRDNY